MMPDHALQELSQRLFPFDVLAPPREYTDVLGRLCPSEAVFERISIPTAARKAIKAMVKVKRAEQRRQKHGGNKSY